MVSVIFHFFYSKIQSSFFLHGFYQGIDFDLVFELSKRMSHVLFVFVGRVNNLSEINKQKWKSIINLSNTMHHGLCSKEDVPNILRSLDVNCLFYSSGKSSFAKDCYPLKLHEGLASGIPLVSTPIRSVAAFSDHVLLASSIGEWEEKITLAIAEPEKAPSSSIASDLFNSLK